MIIAARVKPKPCLKIRYGLKIQTFETWIFTLKLVFFTVTITLLSGQKNEDKGMISHRICMEAISTFFAKDGSNDQRIAMFPYKMDTLYAYNNEHYVLFISDFMVPTW